MSQRRPKRGQVQITGIGGFGVIPREPSFRERLYDVLGNLVATVVFLFALGLLALLVSAVSDFQKSRDAARRTQCEGLNYGLPCLEKAPARPARSARFEVQFGPGADSTINFVITDAHISIHVVQTLPPEIEQTGIRVTKGVSNHLSSLKSFPPLIFSGAVDMHVGPIKEHDHFTTRILLTEDAFKSVETLVETLYDGSARGPPRENEISPILDVYILGTLSAYYGPDQHGESIHDARIIDLGASRGDWNKYENGVKEWRKRLAKDTEFPDIFFKDASSNDDALGAALKGHAYEMQNPSYRWRVDHPYERREEYRRSGEGFHGVP